jgi:hypothetical protein
MKLLKILLAAAIVSGVFLSLANARPQYAKKEGKACTFCHVKVGSKELTDAGKYYKDHNHSLEGYQAPEKKKAA